VFRYGFDAAAEAKPFGFVIGKGKILALNWNKF
jgi:hypothetical protein